MNYRVEVLCFSVAVIAYVNTFQAEFVYDDNRAILKNADILPTTPLYKVFVHDFWGTPMIHSGSHKSYRPITVLTFRINYVISGLQPWSYHVTNTLLHAITTWLFVIFMRTRIFVVKSKDQYDFRSLISGLIFALHPIHTEAVAGLVGRADVLATLFTLAALLSYARICDLSNRAVSDSARHRNESLQTTRKDVSATFCSKKNTVKINARMRRNPNKSLSWSKRNSFSEYPDNRSKTRRKTKRMNNFNDGSKPFEANLSATQDKDLACPLNNPNILFQTSKLIPFLFAVLALLSKEQGICAFPLCAIYDIWVRNELGVVSVGRIILFPGTTAKKYRNLCIRVRTNILSTLILILLRIVPTVLYQTGDHFSPSFSSSDNPASASNSFLTRTLTFHYLLAFNAWLLSFPSTLSYDWSMDSIPLIETVWDSRNFFTLALYLVLTTISLRIAKTLRIRDEKFSLMWTVVSENKKQTLKSRTSRKTKRNVSPHCELTTTLQLPNLTTHFPSENKLIFELDEVIETETACLDRRHNANTFNKYDMISECKPSSRLKESVLDVNTGTIWLPCSFGENSPSIDNLDRTLSSIHHDGQMFPSQKENQERTNSSGYATDNSLDDQDEIACQKYDLRNCQSKFLQASGINDETGSFCSDSSFETLPEIEEKHDLSPALTCHIPQNYDIMIMGLAMMVISFLPATNLFFYVGFVVAERLLYMPSMGYCILIVQGTWHMAPLLMSSRTNKQRIYKKFATAIILIPLLVSAAKTITRNADWKNEYTLYRSGVIVNPAKSWANLGNVLKVSNKIAEAEFAYLKALNTRSNMADVHYNLGLLYQEQTRYDHALERYNKAIIYRPTLAVAHLNRGIVLAALRRSFEAETAYRRVVEINDNGLRDPQVHAKAQFSALYNLGCLLASQSRHDEAVFEFTRAVERVMDNYEPQSLYNMLGQSLHKLGKLHEAENWFKVALTEKPDHIPAHLTYARLLSQQSRTIEAEELYKNALRIEPDNHTIYHHLGLFYLGLKRRDLTLRMLEKGINTASGANDFDILMTAANTYKDTKNYGKSEEYYRKCTILKPESAAAHMNLGAILHLRGNLKEAQASYMKSLSIQPNEQLIRKNLSILKESIRRNVKSLIT